LYGLEIYQPTNFVFLNKDITSIVSNNQCNRGDTTLVGSHNRCSISSNASVPWY